MLNENLDAAAHRRLGGVNDARIGIDTLNDRGPIEDSLHAFVK